MLNNHIPVMDPYLRFEDSRASKTYFSRVISWFPLFGGWLILYFQFIRIHKSRKDLTSFNIIPEGTGAFLIILESGTKWLGSVVQSIVSLTSSLRGQLVQKLLTFFRLK